MGRKVLLLLLLPVAVAGHDDSCVHSTVLALACGSLHMVVTFVPNG